MKAIIFDFDGVIHDTFEYHRSALEETLEEPFPAQTLRDVHRGNVNLNPKAADLERVDWAAYNLRAQDAYARMSVEEEVLRVLVALEQRFRLFIISSGPEGALKAYLHTNDLKQLFVDVLGKETHRSKVEKFRMIFEQYGYSPKDCLFVTDTLGDILEAKQAGVRTVAVTFGYHPRGLLEQGEPWKIITAFSTLLDVV